MDDRRREQHRQSQQRRRARLAASGVRFVTVPLATDARDAMARIQGRREGMTEGEAITRALLAYDQS